MNVRDASDEWPPPSLRTHRASAPDLPNMVTYPAYLIWQAISWAEFWIGVGFQRALFPDYVTRVMAADSQKTLRRANIILAIAPFVVQARPLSCPPPSGLEGPRGT